VPDQRHPTAPQPSASEEEPTDDSIVHFALAGLLPPGHILALHRFLGTLSHLTLVQEQPRMLGEQLFFNTEVSLLLPLLEQYPHYCPYEVLWASFHGSTSETGYLLTRHYRRRLRRKTNENGGERDAPR
jgi:hypothetical protein